MARSENISNHSRFFMAVCLIRSLVFNIYIFFATICIFLGFLPFLVFWGRETACIVPRVWAINTIWAAKYILGINYQIRGELPTKPVIVACKHQSAWETTIFHYLLPNAAYILKKELIYIPFFGLYSLAAKQIPVDRGAGASAIKNMIRKTRERIAENRSVIIFPEGTRTEYGTKPAYKAGVAALYSSVEADVIPVALDSGKLWGRNSFIKKPGMITLSFLPAIERGLSKPDFMHRLETAIEDECAKL